MFLTQLKIASAVVLVLALLALGATFCPSAASPQTGGTGTTPAPQPAQTGGSTAKPTSGQLAGEADKSSQKAKAAEPITITIPQVVIDEVDLKYKTISVTIVRSQSTAGSQGGGSSSGTSSGGAPTRLVNLPVDKHVEIVVNNEVVPLGGLKPGMKVDLKLTVEEGRFVVASVGTLKRDASDLAMLERKLKDSEARLRAAQRAADETLVRLEKAKEELANAKGADNREKAERLEKEAAAAAERALAEVELVAVLRENTLLLRDEIRRRDEREKKSKKE